MFYALHNAAGCQDLFEVASVIFTHNWDNNAQLETLHLVVQIKNQLSWPTYEFQLELVSKELNHFGVIAGLFRQIGGHSRRFVLFCSFHYKND